MSSYRMDPLVWKELGHYFSGDKPMLAEIVTCHLVVNIMEQTNGLPQLSILVKELSQTLHYRGDRYHVVDEVLVLDMLLY